MKLTYIFNKAEIIQINSWKYEGRSINKLQNNAILLVFQI